MSAYTDPHTERELAALAAETDQNCAEEVGSGDIVNPISGGLIDRDAAIAAVEQQFHGSNIVIGGQRHKVVYLAEAVTAIRALPAAQPAQGRDAISKAAAQARDVFSGSCDHTCQAIDYMEQVILSALEPAAQDTQEPWGWWLRDLTLPPEKDGVLIRRKERLEIAKPPEEWEVTPLFTAPAAQAAPKEVHTEHTLAAAQDGAEVEMAECQAFFEGYGAGQSDAESGETIARLMAERDALKADNERMRAEVVALSDALHTAVDAVAGDELDDKDAEIARLLGILKDAANYPGGIGDFARAALRAEQEGGEA